MSEDALWDRIRRNVGHRGHFTRIEYNPTAGVPDVQYVIKGVEGWLELKFREDTPVRAETPAFLHGGLRDDQIAWNYTHHRHGGRAYVLAQVENALLLVSSAYARRFNVMTMHQLHKASVWSTVVKVDWNGLVKHLTGKEL